MMPPNQQMGMSGAGRQRQRPSHAQRSRQLNQSITAIARYLQKPMGRGMQAGMVSQDIDPKTMRQILHMLARRKRQQAQRMRQQVQRQGRQRRVPSQGRSMLNSELGRHIMEETGQMAAESLL